jgi:hypothetical protein
MEGAVGAITVQATGAVLWRPYFLTLLAEVSGHARQPEEGLRLLAEAQTPLETSKPSPWSYGPP